MKFSCDKPTYTTEDLSRTEAREWRFATQEKQ
jgi:hypothetical protein